jgi:hypothetical protein
MAYDPKLEDYNIPSRVDDFVNTAMQQANATAGNDLLWTMGCDFSGVNAAYWYGPSAPLEFFEPVLQNFRSPCCSSHTCIAGTKTWTC